MVHHKKIILAVLMVRVIVENTNQLTLSVIYWCKCLPNSSLLTCKVMNCQKFWSVFNLGKLFIHIVPFHTQKAAQSRKKENNKK